MSAASLPLLIMTGASEASEPERMVSQARQAVTLDLVERALTVAHLQPIVVATNSTDLAERLAGFPVQVDLDDPDEPFHFGQRLVGLIERYGMERCFYIGGGAGPLLPASEMAAIARKMLDAERLLITNNFYSSDFVAFAPTSALGEQPLPDNDNELAWQLHESKRILEEHLPVPVTWFNYPYGAYDDRIVAAVQEAGYAHAVTINPSSYQYRGRPYHFNRFFFSYDATIDDFAKRFP